MLIGNKVINNKKGGVDKQEVLICRYMINNREVLIGQGTNNKVIQQGGVNRYKQQGNTTEVLIGTNNKVIQQGGVNRYKHSVINNKQQGGVNRYKQITRC